ncbi:unnamed protein product [Paramecium primaurelia]|uniref:Uncharacterized protein n=1 Tax=Paramecium primaurelia TaxID=5886 RepID=A0A8S1L5L6_PARPR|nr:unnamed protein product [Paramecium primaurelia]
MERHPEEQFQSKEKQFKYELLPQRIYLQQKMCWAIAINHNNKFLVTGAESNINVFQFNNGEIKKIQIIQKHQSWITTLNFCNQMSLIISGSSCVKIWSQNLLSNPKCLFVLSEHSSMIQCIVYRYYNPSIIISGSRDSTIKFWYQKELQWICQQTIKEHSNSVAALSLNQEGNVLISCGDDHQILIIKYIDNQKWKIIQKIQGQGVRLSFITKETFAFQSWQSNKLLLYKFEQQTGLYLKTKELQIKGSQQFCTFLFPCVYIPSKLIFLSKNGYNLNIIRFNTSNFDGHLEQAIEFDYPNNWLGNIFGTMSEDGEYLITWDSKSKQLQIRQYKEIDLQKSTTTKKNCRIF